MKKLPTLIAMLTAIITAAHSLRAQDCEDRWIILNGNAGLDGPASAAYWFDPDGPGGSAAELIVGGNFRAAGNTAARGVARWDGQRWWGYGTGLEGWIHALAIYNGELIAGGWFGYWEPNHNVARWDGESWRPLADGLHLQDSPNSGWVNTLVVYQDRLIAGGYFERSGDTVVRALAAWDGNSWAAIPDSPQTSTISAAIVHENRLVIGGGFSACGDVQARNVATWDGSVWEPLASLAGSLDGGVYSLAVHEGELVAAGNFRAAGGVALNGVAHWDGYSWRPFGAGVDTWIVRSAASTGSELFVVTDTEGFSGGLLVRWDGDRWTNEPTGWGQGEQALAVAGHGGRLAVTGLFTEIGDRSAFRVGMRLDNGSPWGERA